MQFFFRDSEKAVVGAQPKMTHSIVRDVADRLARHALFDPDRRKPARSQTVEPAIAGPDPKAVAIQEQTLHGVARQPLRLSEALEFSVVEPAQSAFAEGQPDHALGILREGHDIFHLGVCLMEEPGGMTVVYGEQAVAGAQP